MTPLLNNLRLVSNYSETSNRLQTMAQITYMDMIETPSEELLRIKKRVERENKISELLDEEYKKEEHLPFDIGEQYYSSIQPVIKTQTLNSKSYQKEDDILFDVFQTLDNLTNQQSTSGDLKRDSSDNDDAFSNKLLHKIHFTNQLVGKNSRRGPAKTIIIGLEAWEIIRLKNSILFEQNGISVGKIIGMDIIPTQHISKNKVILMRVESKTDIGINLINSKIDKKYYLGATPNWGKSIEWFNII